MNWQVGLYVILVVSSIHDCAARTMGKRTGYFDSYRGKRVTDHIVSDCLTVSSNKGHFYYVATEDTEKMEGACGIYLMAKPNEIIEVHFDYIDMPCDDNELIAFIDGWELNGSIFPSEADTSKPLKDRVYEFCGTQKMKKVFISEQNAALIQYTVPRAGKGFSFHVTTRRNSAPCNILTDKSIDTYTLRNYGKKVNCTLLVPHPAHLQVLSMTVGNDLTVPSKETGILHNCEVNGFSDHVQIGGGNIIGEFSVIADSICGVDSIPGKILNAAFCGVTRIKLISSENSNNMITVKINEVTTKMAEEGMICPLNLYKP